MKNNPANFIPIRFETTKPFYGSFLQRIKEKNKISSDMRSVPDPKIATTIPVVTLPSAAILAACGSGQVDTI